MNWFNRIIMVAVAGLSLPACRENEDAGEAGKQFSSRGGRAVAVRSDQRPEAPVDTRRIRRLLVDGTVPWQDRVRLCETEVETGRLAPEELDDLLALLSEGVPAGNELEDWFVVENELFSKLRETGVGGDRLTGVLMNVATDVRKHYVVRDYAVQHLSLWMYPSAPESPREVREAERRKGCDAIRLLALDATMSHTSLPATALMAMASISERAPAAESDALWGDAPVKIGAWFEGPASRSVASRVAALQAVSRSHQDAMFPVALRLAQDTQGDASVRISAIAALGYYARPETEGILLDIAKQPGRFSMAARAALERMKEASPAK